jgi:hypothetical protein
MIYNKFALCQQSGQLTSFQQYLDLLNNAAVVYNSHQQSGLTGRSDSNSCSSVYATHGEYDNFGLDNVYKMGTKNDDTSFSIDSPLSTSITAFAAQQRCLNQPSGPPDPSTCLTKNGESSHPTAGIGGLLSSNRRVLMADQ